MNQTGVHFCPMHREIDQPAPGTCPKCGMDLLPEGTRFGLVRHIVQNPMMIYIMIAIMVAAMAAFMMLR